MKKLRSFWDRTTTEGGSLMDIGRGRKKVAKYDADKPRLDLVPPGIIEAVGIVRDYGTRKYGDPDNWRNVEPERYVAALMRHLCKFLRNPHGVDEESGIPHLFHMACNIAFLVEMYMEAMKEE